MTNADLFIYMFEDIRKVTLEGIKDLTKEQLFAAPLKGEFPLGSYLMHLAECDLWWLSVLDGKGPDPELKKRCYYNSWYDGSETKYPLPKEPIEITEYIDVMTICREKVIAHVKSLKDSDLDGNVTMTWTHEGKKNSKEMSVRWIIYHLLEHEAHHRGQMFMLARLAGFKKVVSRL